MVADERENRRACLVPQVAKLARSGDFRKEFTRILGPSRNRTIIVVLMDDTMGYLLDRLYEAGGTAAVAMMDRFEMLQVLVMRPATRTQARQAAHEDAVSLIHADSPVDMFFAYVEQAKSVVIRQVAATAVDQELLLFC